MNAEEMIKSGIVTDLVFPLPIGDINIPCERVVYSIVRAKYFEQAMNATEYYAEFFKKCKDIEDFIENGFTAFETSVHPALSLVVKDLLSIGIDDYDTETIFLYCVKNDLFSGFIDSFSEIEESYNSIHDELKSEKDYRQQRRDNRERFTADNSQVESLSEIFSNEVDSAIMNIGVSAAHSVINMVGNSLSESAAKDKLNELFNDRSLRKAVLKGVYTSVVNLHYLVVAFSNDETKFSIPTNEDEKKASKMLNNLIAGLYSEEKIEGVCKEIIALDPYHDEIYKYLIEKYKDPYGDIAELATFFGTNAEDIKNDIAMNYIKSVSVNSEDDAVKAKELLLTYAKTISFDISQDSNSMKYIQGIIDDFDKKYRTVDGVECKTRDGADLAREELPKIKEFIEAVPASTADSLLDYEEMVQEKIVEFDGMFSSDIRENYRKKLEKLLVDFDVNFKKVGLFKAQDRYQAGCRRALEYVKLLPFETIEEYDEAYKKYEEFLPKVGLTTSQATEASQYMQTQKKRIESGKLRSKDNGVEKNEKKVMSTLFVISAISFIIGLLFKPFLLVAVGCLIGGFYVRSKLKKKAEEFAVKKANFKNEHK